jgi:protein-S-isoprenylcysteine O-methyltransferase Ste14
VSDQSVGELFATASRDLSQLVHMEVELAKAELLATAKKGGAGAALLVVALLVGFFATAFLLTAAAFGISALGVALGYGFVCVGGFLLIVALVAAAAGGLGLKTVKGPQRTKTTMSDNVAWAKHPRRAPDRELENLRASHENS